MAVNDLGFGDVLKKYQKDPVSWIDEILGVNLWEKQQDIIRAAWNNRYVCIKSCYASGKSFSMAMLLLAFQHLHDEAIVISTASSFGQTENIWKEVSKYHSKVKEEGVLPGGLGSTLYSRKLVCSESSFAIRFATDKPENVQGRHSPHKLIIVDESAGIDADVNKRLNALMTGGDCHRVDISNPLSPEGPFYEMFSDPKYVKFTISAFDTPNVREGKEVVPGLVTREWVEEKRVEYGEGSPLWNSEVLGEFPEQGENQLIPLTWLKLAVNRWKECEAGSDETVYGLDIGGAGKGETVIAPRTGTYIHPLRGWMGLSGNAEIIGNVKTVAPLNAKIYIDSIGVGHHLVGDMKGTFRPYPINGQTSDGVDKTRFTNLRSQTYWKLREALNPDGDNPLCLPDDSTLVSQLSSIKYKIVDSGGKIAVESKEKMRNRGVTSPDRADAVMYAMIEKGSNFAPISVEGGSSGETSNYFGASGHVGWSEFL